MYKACGLVCKVEDFKPASNNFRSEFIGKDQSGRKQYRGISFKKTQFGSIEDINYYPLMKEFIEIAGKSELLKTVKDYCREHCAWLKTENDIENHAIDCLLSKAYEYWKDFPKQMPEPDKWIFYFKSIKMLESHEEKYILHYCISLMQELVGCFEEWYRWVHGENAIEELSEEERFCYNMSYFHIVQELFLFRTSHSGGTSTRAKCRQFGVDSSENVEFKFSEEEDG